MVVATQAIVFSAIKYSEADLIATCYTETSGVRKYLLRGILRSKRQKLKASQFQPLTLLELIAEHRNKGTLDYIKEAKILKLYQTLHTDIVKTGLVMFSAEILKNCIHEEEANVPLFNFIKQSLCWLDTHNEVANFHIYFLLGLSMHLGFYPDATNLQEPYFNIAEGNFQATNRSKNALAGSQVENLKYFFGLELDAIHTVKLLKRERQNLLDLLLVYYGYHQQGFQKPKSLVVLNQLFS